MRIIAGQRRGLVLNSFDDDRIRPTKDMVKESIFNSVANLLDITTCSVCDIFAGTGSLGIEALSRGAAAATFVENDNSAVQLIRNNLLKARLVDHAQVIQTDATVWLKQHAEKPFDLILADPPYTMRLGNFIIENSVANGYLKAEGILVIESAPDEPMVIPDSMNNLVLYKEKKWGESFIRIFRFQ